MTYDEHSNSSLLKVYRNGLVQSDGYYTELNENYVVGYFRNAVWPELTYEALKTLNGRQWLLDVVIDLSFHSSIKKYNVEKYVLLTSDKTFAIFNYFKDLHKDFFRSTTI